MEKKEGHTPEKREPHFPLKLALIPSAPKLEYPKGVAFGAPRTLGLGRIKEGPAGEFGTRDKPIEDHNNFKASTVPNTAKEGHAVAVADNVVVGEVLDPERHDKGRNHDHDAALCPPSESGRSRSGHILHSDT